MLNEKNNRRGFIKSTAKNALMISFGMSGISTILANDLRGDLNITHSSETGFDQKPLPYAFNALENMIDAMTMEIHYSKHAAAYAKNLKEAAIPEKVNMNESVELLLSKISGYSIKMRNNAGGHYNHEMFWQCMRPMTSNNMPVGILSDAINKQFGSFDALKKQFTDAAKNRFGSGWAWLCIDKSGKLSIGSTANQDNPLMDIPAVEIKGNPILCLDVWEHAYYIKYQNKRIDYIENWWSLVNWDFVQKRFENK